MRSKTAPAGRPVGPPRGGSCYLDNIEISEANCKTFLFVCLLMLIFAFCEGVSLLRKITITVDDVTLDCLRAMREFGIPCSAAIRRAVWAYYQDNFSYILPVQKK